MAGDASIEDLRIGLGATLARAGLPSPEDLIRLTGGAMMQSWRFNAGDGHFVLRRAPSERMMEDRPFGHDVEAAIIRAARAAGVAAAEIVAELEPGDGIGSGFVMRAIPGTADPREILECSAPSRLMSDCAQQLAAIHSLDISRLPEGVPAMDYAAALEKLSSQFAATGGDRPIIALSLKWLHDNLPVPVEPRLCHGDFRMGNLLADGSRLTGVLDWELAHLGDPHEDLAYACMTVWRFHRIEREALGLASLEDWIAAYEAAGGAAVDRERLRFWLIYRTCWWALGCLGMATSWREGHDRTLERAVISRRTSEQELDLLLLLEENAPEAARGHPLPCSPEAGIADGEAGAGELATAVSEWLAAVKHRIEGYDRFQLAVARNALGIIARAAAAPAIQRDAELAKALLAGEVSLASPGLLARLRAGALTRLAIDSPKYPALATARRKWAGED